MIPTLRPTILELIAYFILHAVLFTSLFIAINNQDYFNNHYATEDGFIEWGTAILLFSGGFVLLLKTIKIWFTKSKTWKIGMLIFAFLFFFASGEEISWGQRLFNLQSNNFFIENNLQKETNLHNLVLGDVSINKLIFSKILVGVLLVYILIIPICYLFYNWFQRTVDRFAIPIMQMHHIVAFLITTVIIITIPAERKWEVYEFCFAFIFLMIFLKPFNNWIYNEAGIYKQNKL